MNELPLIKFDNLFAQDSTGQKIWSYFFKSSVYEKFKPRFLAMGAASAQATAHSQTVDKHTPELEIFNSVGDRTDRITYHPSYTDLKKLSYGLDIVSLKYNKTFLAEHKDIRHQLGFAIAYYFAQTETGLFCPICMTDALGRVMEKHNTLPQTQEVLKHIGHSDLSQLWEGAMFMTEKQGGSDVGTNSTRAENKNGKWYLYGDKWFCSNADAQAILALARMPGDEGAPDKGTRGLGLFLILRNDPINNSSSWLTHRLKNKLGVRSMASGEISLNGTTAYLIGGAGEGFKIMTEMVNMSRIYNAVASLGIVRRSLMEAMAFGQERKAFGSPLKSLPLWRACIADLAAEHLGLLFLVFEATKQLDKADSGDATGMHLLRLITPLAKAAGGKLSVFAASEAMELIGGNAYIEDHIMPRLLRDAQVLPIWEGTTNIQSLDMIRALQKETPTALFERCQSALKNAKTNSALLTAGESKFKELQSLIQSLAGLSSADTQRLSRQLLESAARTLEICLLLEATQNAELKPIVEAAAQRLIERPHITSALGGCSAQQLSATDDTLLNAIF